MNVTSIKMNFVSDEDEDEKVDYMHSIVKAEFDRGEDEPLEDSKMINETGDVPKTVETGSGSGGTTTIDWTMYRFPNQLICRWYSMILLGWIKRKLNLLRFILYGLKMTGWLGQPILASLENTLFDIYSSDAYTAKVLWDKLDQTHNTDSQGFEKYSVARFLDFKLVDGKSMTEQVHEFEMLVHDLGESGMVLLEKFRVMYVIEKLPKSWEEFALSLKRQKGEVSVVTVGQKRKVVTKKANTKPYKNKAKKPMANKPCWSCGRVGHWSKDCPSKKAGVVAQANTVLGLGTTNGPVANMVIGEVVASGTDDGYVTYNPVLLSTYLSHEWLIDTRANVHICADISLFVSYQQSHRVTVTIGNASAAQVLRIGNVDLKFASGRILSLTRVYHVPSIRRNIISGSCLVKNGFELSLKCNKVVITHTSTFFGKGYLSDGLFLINVEPVLGGFINDSVAPSVNCVESSDLWHLRLGHLNLGAVKNMLNLELIPKYAIDKKSKCQVLFPEHKRKKLGPKTVDCIFLGYLETTTAMRFLVLKSDIDGIVANTIVEFRDATFFEEMTNVGVDPGSSSTPNKVEEPRRSKRAKVVKDFGSDFITYNVEDEPLTFRQAKDSSESRHWKGAVKSEIDSIISNGTWELVDLPPGCSTIGCKWIFKRKLNPDGSINKYKARLVAKGFRQMEGIDYFDTYSPVARMTTIRMLIALASVHGLIIHQMDVKTAFLHGDLEEEIYMDQPEGFVASGNERKVCRLVKSIYALKQAPIDWHKKFDETVLDFKFFLVNESDKCVYYKVRGNDCVFVCLYVDDILLFGTNIEIINETKSFLKMHFEMKDMGDASVILGIKLTQSTDGITLSQSHYIEKSILEKVLRYLKETISLGLHYRRFPGVLEGYSDASWIAKKSGSNGVELFALDATGREAEWLHELMSMLPVVSKPLPAISVHCDRRTTIDKVRSIKYNAKTKRHIQVRLKSIRGLVSDRIIAIEFIGTQDNIADPLTKGIEHAIVLKSRLGMGLVTHHNSSTEGTQYT
ncbi:hypothetical protein AgCh_038452 [Apium graveolens]